MTKLQKKLRDEAEKFKKEKELRDQMIKIEEQEIIQNETISIDQAEEVLVEAPKQSQGRVKGKVSGHAEADELTTVEYENRRIFKRVNKHLRMQQRKKIEKMKFDRSRAKRMNFAAAQPIYGDEPRNLRPLALFDIDKEMQKVEDGKIKMREQERLMSRKFGEFFLNRKEEARGLVPLDRLGAPLEKIQVRQRDPSKKYVNKKLEMKAKSLNAWGKPKFKTRPSEVKPKISENIQMVHVHNRAGGDSNLPTESEERYERLELEKEAGIAPPLNINDLPGLNDNGNKEDYSNYNNHNNNNVNYIQADVSVDKEIKQAQPIENANIDVSAKPNELTKKSIRPEPTNKKQAKIYQPGRYKRSRSKSSKHKANADRLLPGNRMQSFIERNSKPKGKSRSRSRNRNIGTIKSLKKPKIGGIYGIDKNQLKSHKKRERERSLSQKSVRADSRKDFDPNRLATISQGFYSSRF